MKQQFVHDAENAPLIAAPLQTANVAETEMLLVEKEVTLEEKRTAVLAALRSRIQQNERVMLRLRFISYMIVLSVVMGGFNILVFRHFASKTSAVTVQTHVIEPSKTSVVTTPRAETRTNAALKLIKVSDMKKGQAAYLYLDGITELAKGRKASETFAILTMPTAENVVTGDAPLAEASLWKIVKIKNGYNVIGYSSVHEALALANGKEAIVNGIPFSGDIEVPIPLKRFAIDRPRDADAAYEDIEVTLPALKGGENP